jgi:short-subunit dehydrogenase
MELWLNGRIAGSSRGIGRGIALAFAREGCDLLLTGRDAAALDEVAQSIRTRGGKATVCDNLPYRNDDCRGLRS